jgi:hypothetical protein
VLGKHFLATIALWSAYFTFNPYIIISIENKNNRKFLGGIKKWLAMQAFSNQMRSGNFMKYSANYKVTLL